MLVVSRAKGESVMVVMPDGSLVEVTVVRLSDDTVRLGFTAPENIAIDRLEIWERKQAEREAAENLDPPPGIG